jgi:predicted RNA binding protein YcfA (HicA-like mRNA interferase family)
LSKLPRLSGRDCVKALAKAGFYLKRQHGSHVRWPLAAAEAFV